MNNFRADLHCHTTCSDGSDSPEQVLQLAKSIGLSGLSITDHDSIAAYEQALPLAAELGLRMVPGVEFSTMHKGVSVHILAYAFPLTAQPLHHLCSIHHERRENRNRDILKKLQKEGMIITEEEIETTIPPELRKAKRTIGRPHIAYMMMQKGYVTSIVEAFKKYLGEGKLCYVPGTSISTQETIDIIHQSKGLAVIAHPHLIEEAYILHDLMQMNFDGIECYYARFALDLQQRWLKIAAKKNWLITGGSDFHGSIKPTIPLGCSWVDEEKFNTLWNHYEQNK